MWELRDSSAVNERFVVSVASVVSEALEHGPHHLHQQQAHDADAGLDGRLFW
jgi:hypothetical protein